MLCDSLQIPLFIKSVSILFVHDTITYRLYKIRVETILVDDMNRIKFLLEFIDQNVLITQSTLI